MAGLHFVADIDVNILNLGAGLRIDLEVVDGFNLTGGLKGFTQILVGDFGGYDIDPLLGKGPDGIDCESQKNQSCSPDRYLYRSIWLGDRRHC